MGTVMCLSMVSRSFRKWKSAVLERFQVEADGLLGILLCLFEGVSLGHATLKSGHFHGVPALFGGNEVHRVAGDIFRGHVTPPFVVTLTLAYRT